MTSNPATQADIHREVAAAEARADKTVQQVADHFDQRIADSESKLTWRMIATVGVGSILSGITANLASGGAITKSAAAFFGLF